MSTEEKRIPLPAYVSGCRQRIAGDEYIVICGADGRGYAFVACGRNAHLYALADAKEMVAALNTRAAANAAVATIALAERELASNERPEGTPPIPDNKDRDGGEQ